jgi:hypothetical protein
MDQLLTVLAGLITSGDKTVKLELPELPIRYNYKLDQDISRSTGTVRVPQAYLILENCLYVCFINLLKNFESFLGVR